MDLEQTVAKFKKIANFNLSNHKEATDRLRQQLKDTEAKCQAKDDENRQLQNKLTVIKVQISKLEKVQLREISRSRSGSRRGNDTFRFGSSTRQAATALDNHANLNIQDC